jgi:hypothetical protein
MPDTYLWLLSRSPSWAANRRDLKKPYFGQVYSIARRLRIFLIRFGVTLLSSHVSSKWSCFDLLRNIRCVFLIGCACYVYRPSYASWFYIWWNVEVIIPYAVTLTVVGPNSLVALPFQNTLQCLRKMRVFVATQNYGFVPSALGFWWDMRSWKFLNWMGSKCCPNSAL